MAITAKVIFYKHKVYKDGTSPIIIQAIVNRRAIRKVIARVRPDQWLISQNKVSGKKHTEADRINADITNELVRINKDISDSEHTASGVRKAMKGQFETSNNSFSDFYEGEIVKYKQNGQASKFETHINILKQFRQYALIDNIAFEKIDEVFIYQFGIWLSEVRHNSKNTIYEKMHCLSTIIKRARKRKLIILDPFLYLNFKREKTRKSKLNIPEFQSYRSVELPIKLEESRDFFITSVFMRGIRLGDLLSLKSENFEGNQVSYVELKTGNIMKMTIRPEVLEIIEKYKGGEYIFSLLKWKHDSNLSDSENKFAFRKAKKRATFNLNNQLKAIAKLAGIEKNLSIHVARHTFAKMAIDSVKNTRISKDLLGHSSLSAHEVYVMDIKDNDELDQAADKIFDFGSSD